MISAELLTAATDLAKTNIEANKNLRMATYFEEHLPNYEKLMTEDASEGFDRTAFFYRLRSI